MCIFFIVIFVMYGFIVLLEIFKVEVGLGWRWIVDGGEIRVSEGFGVVISLVFFLYIFYCKFGNKYFRFKSNRNI